MPLSSDSSDQSELDPQDNFASTPIMNRSMVHEQLKAAIDTLEDVSPLKTTKFNVKRKKNFLRETENERVGVLH